MAQKKDDQNDRKLHPWLRIVKNGDGVVNAGRADGSTRVACSAAQEGSGGVQVAAIHEQMARQDAPRPNWTASAPDSVGELPKRLKLGQRPPAHDSHVNVFIEFFPGQQVGETADAAAEMESVKQLIEKSLPGSDESVSGAVSTRRNFICATVPVTMLDELKQARGVAYVHPSEPLKLDRPQPGGASLKEPKSKAVGSENKHGRGKGVLIGIIDVDGFDFSHPDFLDEHGKTRFVSIWDQGGDFRPPPKGFDRGSEFRKEQLDKAIEASRKPGMPPAPWIERQSQLRPGSHGTHVASIAAGNSGVCPKSPIAAVLLDVPVPNDEVERRRSTFSDTSQITHAVEYLLGVAKELGLPVSINISLGTNGGSHDGASGVSRWLDAYLATPGRAICVAAGNAGQDRSHSEDDMGWVMGRIHTSGKIPQAGLTVELEWTVIGDGIEDWSENELEIWYSAQDRFVVAVKPPDADEWIEVKPRSFVENRRLPSGVTLSVYNELYHPVNGANYVGIYLSPNYDPDDFRGITPGVWRVRLHGEAVRVGKFDAWIERDDPLEIGREGGRRMFYFPSFFSEKSNVDSHSITSLACGHRVIAVANLDDARQQINPSSSQGPTRDGRCKPEISAPGTLVVAANGFGDPDERWIAMTGTSMASPYVAGVVGLMLARNPDLTAAQCLGILQRTARPLAGASYEWGNDVGFGRFDAEAALEEARLINRRNEIL